MPSGYNAETSSNPAETHQYPMASRPAFGGFNTVSELYPEDILNFCGSVVDRIG